MIESLECPKCGTKILTGPVVGGIIDYEEFVEQYPEAIIFDNPSFKEAIVGYTNEGAVVYDFSLMVESLSSEYEADGESEDPVTDAIEWIEYNSLRSLPYMGDGAPVVINLFMGWAQLLPDSKK